MDMDKEKIVTPVSERQLRSVFPSAGVYVNPTPGELPIVGTGNFRGNTYYGKYILDLFKECGINIAQFQMGSGAPQTTIRKGMDGNQEHLELLPNSPLSFNGKLDNLLSNIQYSLVNCNASKIFQLIRIGYPGADSGLESWVRNWEKIVKEPFDYASWIAGWMLDDESPQSKFVNLANAKSTIQRFALEQYQDLKVYVNLLPCWSWSRQYNRSDTVKMSAAKWLQYLNYLEAFKAEFNPNPWSFDFYAFSRAREVGHTDRINKLGVEYFRSLWLFWKISGLTGVPFWPYLRVMDRYLPYNDDWENDCIATIPRLRLQAFCSLAFGAQGLVCWNMCTRWYPDKGYLMMYPDNDKDNGIITTEQTFMCAPLNVIYKGFEEIGLNDAKGRQPGLFVPNESMETGKIQKVEKTPIYTNLQEVLKQVRAHQDVFLGSTVTDIKRGSVPSYYEGVQLDCIPIMTSEFGSISEILDAKSALPPVLISRVSKGMKEYMVIVNLDWKNDIQFKVKINRTVVLHGTNITYTPAQAGENGLDFALPPADWLILETK